MPLILNAATFLFCFIMFVGAIGNDAGAAPAAIWGALSLALLLLVIWGLRMRRTYTEDK